MKVAATFTVNRSTEQSWCPRWKAGRSIRRESYFVFTGGFPLLDEAVHINDVNKTMGEINSKLAGKNIKYEHYDLAQIFHTGAKNHFLFINSSRNI